MFGVTGIIIGWLSNQVGLKTDVANSNGSVHAKLRDIRTIVNNISVVTDNARISNDQELILTGQTSLTAREFVVVNPGKVRIKVDGQRDNQVSTTFNIFVDDVQVATQDITTYQSYSTYNFDVFVKSGSKISVKVFSVGAIAVHVRNCRICFDLIYNDFGTAV